MTINLLERVDFQSSRSQIILWAPKLLSARRLFAVARLASSGLFLPFLNNILSKASPKYLMFRK
jgi:hypothetical protein